MQTGYLLLNRNAPSHKIKHSHFCVLFPAASTSATLLSCLICYLQVRVTLLFLSSKKNYHRNFSGTPRLSRYSFLACSRSSSVGAVLYFEYKSLITKASNFASNPCFILGKFSSISNKWNFTSSINNCSGICICFIRSSFQLRNNAMSLVFATLHLRLCNFYTLCIVAFLSTVSRFHQVSNTMILQSVFL